MLEDIIGYPNYQVSRDGRIFSKRRGIFLKPQMNSRGYYHVCLGTSRRNKTIHRLVAIQFIPNPEDKPDIYHRNGVKTDNRIENLRWCNSSENGRNSNISKNNSSGYVGVSWYERDKVWESYITANYKKIHLGYFKHKEDAILARQEAEIEYFGEFRKIHNQS